MQTNRADRVKVPRALEFTLFMLALLWVAVANAIASRAAQGLAVQFGGRVWQALLQSFFLIFLVIFGFRLLDWTARRGEQRDSTQLLPSRAGWPGEWGAGAAIGWGLCLLAVLPVLLTGNLHARWDWATGSGQAIGLGLGTLLLVTLAEELVFRGYPFQRLSAALGSTAAALLLSVGFGAVIVYADPPRHVGLGLLDGTLFGLLLAMAYLRTHALWLGWGLHFAYRAVAAVVLGLPIAGHGGFGSPVEMHTSGPRWLSGGAFGLDAALLTSVAMVGAMVVLYRVTKDYAWRYTHAPIVAGGYEVTVAPPAAHVAMEKAAAPPPLVQILATTPGSRSVVDSGVDARTEREPDVFSR